MNLRSLLPWRKKLKPPTAHGDLVDPFVTLRHDIDRMVDGFFNDLAGRELSPMPGWQGVPDVRVSETVEDIVVTAELPGLDEEDLEVTLSGDLLTITGQKKAESERKRGKAHYIEQSFATFSRSLRLPSVARDQTVEAKFDKGVLTIRVPKPTTSGDVRIV
jgi:HSP20 family protein